VKHLLLALVSLIGLTAFLLWRSPGIPLPLIPFPAARREAPRPAEPAPSSKKASKSAHAAKAERTPTEVAAVPQRPQQPEPDQYSITVTPDLYFPSLTRVRPAAGVVRMVPPPEKIALGEDSDSVTDLYGEPSAWAIAAEGGHMVETFVYAQARGGPATVIRIVDGRVAAAYTKVLPFSPRGSFVPRNLGLPN
jgi:hypothetical protein